MNDPFFDEDDGEFDDLYGNPPPAASSPAAQRKPRSSPSPAAQPLTPGSRSLARSPAASSAVSSSYASNATDLAASGKQDKRRRKHGKARRKDSQELFDVQWQSDVAVSRCGLCRADFSLVRRKHHCRHCGRVMCSDCSSFLFFEFSHRKHRVCSTCNNQLLAEQDAYDRETLANGRDTTSNLFDDSSDEVDVTPVSSTLGDVKQSNLRSSLVSAFTPKHGGDKEKARKKQEKKEKKERKKREKLEKKGNAVPVQTARISRRQVEEVEEKPAANGAALFDGADDEWFTDVPGQRTQSRGSADDQSEGGSKGPGWRDRVKDTYTVTPDQPSVLAPMAGSRLTAGITGNGYISEQFRYDDVGGPGLGHDDDSTVEMPRPKQQRATKIHTDYSAKPSQLSGNGYFSEQFQYDDVGGPGLGHEDAGTVAMPRPKQQPIAATYSYDGVQPSGKRSENGSADYKSSYEQEFQPRLTFKDNLKDIFSGTKRQESTGVKKEKKARTSKPRARGNQSMTMDELNPSYSSEDEPRLPAPAMPRPTLTPAQPTFYDDDADKLVVDDSPGFFEATIAEREEQRKKEEEQQQQLAKDMAWVNGSAVPPTVPAHRFSSEQDSYSLVDPPSHTSNSPVEAQRRSRTASDGVGNKSAKGGFTGALKRFFGMGSKATEKATTPPKPAPVPRTSVVPPPVRDDSAKQDLTVMSTSQLDHTSTHEQVTSRLERHTVMDYYAGAQEEEEAPAEATRFTMAGYGDSKTALSHFEASVPPLVSAASQSYDAPHQKPERKRRGTFDDLFESPKNNVSSDRYSSTGASAWATTGAAAAGRASYGAPAVGVARFDQRRSFDEGDGMLLGAGPQSDPPAARSLNGPAETWRQSTATSLLDDRVDASQSEGPEFTWSNVRSSPGFGTATYAVPTSLQPRAVYDENRESTRHYDASSSAQSAPLGNIMDDLKRSSTVNKSQGKESVDDFFAEFEEPNDYVFDPATGGYVAARVPPRAVAARPVSRSESTELEAPQAMPASRSSGQGYYAPSEPVVRPTARTVVSQDDAAEEVDDEVAEIIVDKISSLESELAALKQLIRSRKGGAGSSHVAKQHHSATRPSARKESIFDNDSSDEESSKPRDPYATSIQPAQKRESRKRPGSKKKHVKKRKDSFADLFEDSPNEAETLGGATSYEALFQTGATQTGAGQEQVSDDEEELAPKSRRAKSKKSRRRSSRKINDVVATKVDSDSEPEFASLKGRRGKKSFSRRDTSDDLESAGVKSDDQLVTPVQVDVIPALKPVKTQVEEEDPIDALFDTSGDHDVAKLYGGDNANAEGDESSAVKPQIVKLRSELFTQVSSTSLTDDEGSGDTSAVAANASSVASISREPSGHISDLSAQGLDQADEEEDFAINWAKMRTSKSRRRKSGRGPPDSSVNPDESVAADTTTDLLAPSSLGTKSDVEVTKADDLGNPEKASAPAPSAFLADAASNWMSVSTLDGESVNLSLTGDEDLSSVLESVDEAESVESSFETAPTGRETRDDFEAPVTPVVESTDITKPVMGAESSANTKEADSSDDPAEDLVHSESSLEVHLGVSKVEPLRPSDSTFDIFDRSGDVDFLSMSTPTATTAVDYEADSAGSENSDRESLPGEDEVFSFEIQAPKKRASELDGQTSSSVPEKIESSPASPLSSADDNVELGKYASTPKPSSRTPSVDGSVDDPEDASVDGEAVLGKVESQAFDADWDQMQAKEKERKKRLQAKQRQAQRDKVLRKQGASSKSLTPHGSSKSKSKSGKKKKKDKEKDDGSQSSHHKKSGSSRKHRHREKEDEAPSEPPRSLTEL